MYYDLSNGEVLNYNDDYSATGWYLKNQYVDDYDNSGTKFGKWYTKGETCGYGIWDGGRLVTPIPYVIPEENWCSFLQKYDWKTDCRLYYNVKQKKTFDEVIKEKLNGMSHSTERLQYYALLAGDETGAGTENDENKETITPEQAAEEANGRVKPKSDSVSDTSESAEKSEENAGNTEETTPAKPMNSIYLVFGAVALIGIGAAAFMLTKKKAKGKSAVADNYEDEPDYVEDEKLVNEYDEEINFYDDNQDE